jgi:hypothetical protein
VPTGTRITDERTTEKEVEKIDDRNRLQPVGAGVKCRLHFKMKNVLFL